MRVREMTIRAAGYTMLLLSLCWDKGEREKDNFRKRHQGSFQRGVYTKETKEEEEEDEEEEEEGG